MNRAILYDATMCIGCKQCEGACAQQNKLPYDDTVAAEDVQSFHKYTVVLSKNDKFMRRLCMHCEKPACASVCPVGAFHKTAEGPVVYDVWKCIGCRYCMVACPFAQPKYEWQALNPRVRKCIMCPDRVVAASKRRALKSVRRAPPSLARETTSFMRPRNVSGRTPPITSRTFMALTKLAARQCFIIAAADVEDYGYPASARLGETPLPEYTGRVMERIPDFIPVWTLVLGGIYWVSHRRDEVAEAEAQHKNGGK